MNTRPSPLHLARRQALLGGVVLMFANRALAMPLTPVRKPTTLTPEAWLTLSTAARDLFPHQRLPQSVYQNIIAQRAAPTQPEARLQLLRDGVGLLNGGQRPAWHLRPERQRLTQLKAIQATPFFQDLRITVMLGLYGDPKVTRHFGYEGPSFEEGGYLDRGFNDLTWLPEPV